MTVFDHRVLEAPSVMTVRPGVDYALEEEALAWLLKGREGVTALSEKREWLSRDQLDLRDDREVLNHTGVCDESIKRGMFRKDHNPLFGQRPSRHTTYDDG